MVYETEKARFHAVSENYEQQRDVGIDVGYYAVLSCGEFCRVQRHQQPVEKPADDGTQAVYYRVFGQ